MDIKSGAVLTENEISQINASSLRDFKVPFNFNDDAKKRKFFILKEGEEILAFAAWGEVKPVIFNSETFTIYAIYDVIANVKGKGYGKKVVTAIKEYLERQNRTIMGFCMPHNTGFYEKCGFKIERNSTQRMVYTKNGERITNKDGQFIFYQDSIDGFIKKVLSENGKEVSIPTDNMW